MNNELIIVDRMENGFAVCEIGSVFTNIPLSHIDGDVHEGDVLMVSDDSGHYKVDKERTEGRRIDIAARFNRLKKRK